MMPRSRSSRRHNQAFSRPHIVAALFVALASIAIPLAATSPAAAQGPTATFSMSPTSGPTGTVVTLTSVTPCPAPSGATDWRVQGTVVYATNNVDGGDHGSTSSAPVAANGTWNLSFTMPVPSQDGEPTGTEGVYVVCSGQNASSVDYTEQSFDFTTSGHGYWLLSNNYAQPEAIGSGHGEVATFGDANYLGTASDVAAPVVGMAPNPLTGIGYWIVGGDGGVFSLGDTHFYGSVPGLGIHINNIVGIASTPDAGGYWLAGSDGGVFSFGDASFFGSLPGSHIVPSKPIVAVAESPGGSGYWLIGADGGVFSFGASRYYGSLPGDHITPSSPIVGMAVTPDGGGYWLVGADGGVFSFGDAKFYGSLPSEHITPARPVVGITPVDDGGGYWLAGADGGVFTFGDAQFYGSFVGEEMFYGGSGPATFLGITATPDT